MFITFIYFARFVNHPDTKSIAYIGLGFEFLVVGFTNGIKLCKKKLGHLKTENASINQTKREIYTHADMIGIAGGVILMQAQLPQQRVTTNIVGPTLLPTGF